MVLYIRGVASELKKHQSFYHLADRPNFGHLVLSQQIPLYLAGRGINFLSFIRDGMKFCLGPSLNFFGNLPSPVPYLSLIFQANFGRLSLNTYFEMKCVCVKKNIEGADF